MPIQRFKVTQASFLRNDEPNFYYFTIKAQIRREPNETFVDVIEKLATELRQITGDNPNVEIQDGKVSYLTTQEQLEQFRQSTQHLLTKDGKPYISKASEGRIE